jgi:hypothetical protein
MGKCMFGMLDAIDEVKTDTDGRTKCPLLRSQESPIKDPARAMTVES